MINKTKLMVASCACLACFSGFIISTNYSDIDAIVSAYRTTVNGSYFKKELSVAEKVKLSDKEESKPALTDIGANANISEWINYVKASNISNIRKNILLEALDTISKGCIYHQLRNTNKGETPAECFVSCDHQIKEGYSAYDYNTQASYKADDPLYLDCSYFIKHCYYMGGVSMISSNTAGMYSSSEFTTITESELIPADIAVKKGHVLMYLGNDSKGSKYWIEMKDHSSDGVISDRTLNESYIYRRFGLLRE